MALEEIKEDRPHRKEDEDAAVPANGLSAPRFVMSSRKYYPFALHFTSPKPKNNLKTGHSGCVPRPMDTCFPPSYFLNYRHFFQTERA